MSTLTRSFWPADESTPVLELTVGDLLRRATSTAPEKQALISVAPDRQPRTWSYAELLEDAEHAAAWLLDRFRPGEHVAVWAPNVPEWLVLQYGAALAGLVLVTTNPALREAELLYALEQSEAVGIFYVDNFRGADMGAMASAVLSEVPSVREAVPLEGWLAETRSTPKRSELPDVDPASPTQIQFTSGTTGRPKAAVLKHQAMVTNAAYCRQRCEVPFGATFGTALPLFHTAGCGLAVMGSFHQQATTVLAEVFDPPTLLQAFEDYRVEVFGGVPLMLHATLAHPEFGSFDLSALRTIMSGGDMVPPALVEAWANKAGVTASAVYGQTELSPILAQTKPSDATDDALHTAGLPLPNVDVAIIDPGTGEIAPIGVEGEICARGYQLMIGYLGMPEETAQTIDEDGWLHTGDLGTMDSRGYLTVTGRLKDMIIRGGENIYPREIEETLVQHPSIANAIILGVPDPEWGETVVGVVQLDPDQSRPTVDELQKFLRERLARHKTPKAWYVTEQPPTNAMGKLQKFRLRDQIADGQIERL